MTWLEALHTKDWTALDQSFPYVDEMRSCIQDPVHHAEGDVWTHTKMVLGQLPEGADGAMRLAALYHDVAKPKTRTLEWSNDLGREIVRHPHHSRLGAQTAWFDLYMADVDLQDRIKAYWLCMWHQKVFHLWSYTDMERLAYQFAAIGDWDSLIEFAKADNRGRVCPNPSVADDNLSLLSEWIHENFGQWSMDSTARIFYLEKEGRSPSYQPPDPTGSTVVIMSGLPGSGKDTLIRQDFSDYAVISLDDLRAKMGVLPTDNQGRVVQAAFEQARVYLREKKNFVWNSTGLTRMLRGKIISLARDYDAFTHIVAMRTPWKEVLRRNREREQSVPEKVVLDMARKWEPPSLLEAHFVRWLKT